MEDFDATFGRLDEQISAAIGHDPLEALALIGRVQRGVEGHQRAAVRAAAGRHSWKEIGDALGVSKQAAHQRFAKEWAATLREELKAETKTFKTLMKKGELHEAADAKERLDAVVDEFKQVQRRKR